MMTKLENLKWKLSVMKNPIFIEIVDDLEASINSLDDINTLTDAVVWLEQELKKELIRASSGVCQGHYRQMDLEEAIENEKKDKYINELAKRAEERSIPYNTKSTKQIVKENIRRNDH